MEKIDVGMCKVGNIKSIYFLTVDLLFIDKFVWTLPIASGI